MQGHYPTMLHSWMTGHHTNEVISHLLQHRLHVLPSEVLGSYQALEHPEHAPNSSLLGTLMRKGEKKKKDLAIVEEENPGA